MFSIPQKVYVSNMLWPTLPPRVLSGQAPGPHQRKPATFWLLQEACLVSSLTGLPKRKVFEHFFLFAFLCYTKAWFSFVACVFSSFPAWRSKKKNSSTGYNPVPYTRLPERPLGQSPASAPSKPRPRKRPPWLSILLVKSKSKAVVPRFVSFLTQRTSHLKQQKNNNILCLQQTSSFWVPSLESSRSLRRKRLASGFYHWVLRSLIQSLWEKSTTQKVCRLITEGVRSCTSECIHHADLRPTGLLNSLFSSKRPKVAPKSFRFFP